MTFLLMRRFPASYHITYNAYVTNGKLFRQSLNCRLIPPDRSADDVRGIVPECRIVAKKAGGSSMIDIGRMLNNAEPARAIPVCSGFGFHGLMTFDETGVLRARFQARRG